MPSMEQEVAIDVQKLCAEELKEFMPDACSTSKEIQAAISAAQKAVAKNDRNFVAWFVLGSLAFKQNQLNQAQEALEKSLSLQPDYFHALHNLAVVFRSTCNWERSKSLLDQALKIRPASDEAWYNLGLIYVQTDDATQYENVLARLESLKSPLKEHLEKFKANYDRME